MNTTSLTTALAAGSFAVLSLAGCAAQSDATAQTGTGATTAPSATSSSAAAGSSSSSSSSFKDGDYTATGQYQNPGGTSKVAVALTLKDDVVTALKVTPEAEDPTSKQYQEKFASGVNALVVGKKLTDLNVTTVSGSSLTSKGFDAAVTAIESEAKA